MTVGMWVGAGLLAAIALEQLLMARVVGFYYAVGVPVAVEPLPIARRPEGSGKTATVRWTVVGDEVRYWSGADGGLVGLHGVVRLVPDRGRFRLVGSWAPPWSLIVFGFAIGAWGAWQGVPFVSVLVAAAIVLGSTAAYQAGAVRAMAELRWSFVRDDDA